MLTFWDIYHAITRETAPHLAAAARTHKLRTLEKNLSAICKQLGVPVPAGDS